MLALAVIGLYSCDKKVETSKVVLEKSDSATINLLLLADLNLTTDEKEPVQNAQVLVSIPNNQFGKPLNSNGTTKDLGNWNKTFTSDNAGNVKIVVPCDNDGVTVTIRPIGFQYAQVQNTVSKVATIQKIFKYSSGGKDNITIDVVPKSQVIRTITYTESTADIIPNPLTVKLTGIVIGEVDTSNLWDATKDYVALPVDIIFYTNDSTWSTTVTTVAKTEQTAGNDDRKLTTFEVNVPYDKEVWIKYNVTMSHISSKLLGPVWKQDYIYKDNRTLGTYTDNEDQIVIDLGDGTAVNFLH